MIRQPISLFLLLILTATLIACGASATPESTPAPPPTWTPTPMSVQMANVDATPTPTATMPPTPTVATSEPTQPPTEQPTNPAPPSPTNTPAPKVAKAIVIAPQANLRLGPGTSHPKAGVVKQGDAFVVLGKNQAGDWWQVQVNGQPLWIFGNLVRVENPNVVAVAEAIPTPPPAPHSHAQARRARSLRGHWRRWLQMAHSWRTRVRSQYLRPQTHLRLRSWRPRGRAPGQLLRVAGEKRRQATHSRQCAQCGWRYAQRA
ncbi:MAG TPA: SH3 domain-containing protein [Anaerolineae bacterium]|nr:SH3 domain-containing protein [Anaerolineae bacterium]